MAWGIADGFDMFDPFDGGATACSSPNACGSTPLSVNAVFDVDVAEIFEVALQAQASATNGALAVASVDPEISILPDFLAALPASVSNSAPTSRSPARSAQFPNRPRGRC